MGFQRHLQSLLCARIGLMFPECSRRLTAQAREEFAEGRGVGKVELIGYLGDAQLGGLQQERGLHQ